MSELIHNKKIQYTLLGRIKLNCMCIHEKGIPTEDIRMEMSDFEFNAYEDMYESSRRFDVC